MTLDLWRLSWAMLNKGGKLQDAYRTAAVNDIDVVLSELIKLLRKDPTHSKLLNVAVSVDACDFTACFDMKPGDKAAKEILRGCLEESKVVYITVQRKEATILVTAKKKRIIGRPLCLSR